MIGVKVPVSVMEKLKAMAAVKGMGVATLARSWILEFLGEK